MVATTGNSNGSTSQQPLYNESIVRLNGSSLQLTDSWQIPLSQRVGDGDFGGSPSLFSAEINGVLTPMLGACNKNGYYYALNQDDLSAGPLWSYEIAVGGPNDECDAAALWDGTNLIEGGGGPTTINGKSFSGSVRSLNPATGQPIWQTGMPGKVIGTPTEDGSGVVAAPVFTSQDGVELLNASTGAVIDTIRLPGSPIFAQPVFAGNDLLVAGTAGNGLTAYEITTPGSPITKVVPSKVKAGTVETVVLTGSGFSKGASVFLSGTRVTIQSVTVTSPTKLSVKLKTTNKAAGVRNITVVEPGSYPYVVNTCTDCLTVTAPS